MKVWTVHLKGGAEPVLVREGFSIGALLLGPVWLAACRAWLPAVFALAAMLAIGSTTTGATRIIAETGLAVLLGLSGRDLLRWSLGWHGYALADVVTARDTDAALERLIARRTDLHLLARLMRAEAP